MMHIRPNDILILKEDSNDFNNLAKGVWEVQGIFLGGVGQENLIELKSLTAKPGQNGGAGNKVHHTTFVPDSLLIELYKYPRRLEIYTKYED